MEKKTSQNKKNNSKIKINFTGDLNWILIVLVKSGKHLKPQGTESTDDIWFGDEHVYGNVWFGLVPALDVNSKGLVWLINPNSTWSDGSHLLRDIC